jgi:hypothetical protein
LSTAPSLADGQRDGLGCSSFEAHLSRDHLFFAQGHVLKQQANHPLAIPVRGPFIMPDSWEIFYQVSNGLPFQRTQAVLLLFLLLMDFLLQLGVRLQTCIPLGF